MITTSDIDALNIFICPGGLRHTLVVHTRILISWTQTHLKISQCLPNQRGVDRPKPLWEKEHLGRSWRRHYKEKLADEGSIEKTLSQEQETGHQTLLGHHISNIRRWIHLDHNYEAHLDVGNRCKNLKIARIVFFQFACLSLSNFFSVNLPIFNGIIIYNNHPFFFCMLRIPDPADFFWSRLFQAFWASAWSFSLWSSFTNQGVRPPGGSFGLYCSLHHKLNNTRCGSHAVNCCANKTVCLLHDLRLRTMTANGIPTILDFP